MKARKYKKLLEDFLSNPIKNINFSDFYIPQYKPLEPGKSRETITFLDLSNEESVLYRAQTKENFVVQMQQRTKPAAPVVSFSDYAGGYLGDAEAL